MEIGTGGAFGDAERTPDFPVRETFDVVQDDHGALSVSQVHQRSAEPLAQLTRLRRIAEWEGDVVGQLVRIAHFPPAHEIERGVRHDPVQPRPEWLIGTKPVERAVRVEEPLLHRIFSVFVREHDGANDTVRTALVHPDEGREGLVRSALRRDDDGALRRGSVSVNRSEH
jgi:hypothetical protein